MRSFWGLSLLVLIVPTAHGVDKSIGKTRTVRFGAFFSLVFCLFGFYVVVLGFFGQYQNLCRLNCYTNGLFVANATPTVKRNLDYYEPVTFTTVAVRSAIELSHSACRGWDPNPDLFLARRIQS